MTTRELHLAFQRKERIDFEEALLVPRKTRTDARGPALARCV